MVANGAQLMNRLIDDVTQHKITSVTPHYCLKYARDCYGHVLGLCERLERAQLSADTLRESAERLFIRAHRVMIKGIVDASLAEVEAFCKLKFERPARVRAVWALVSRCQCASSCDVGFALRLV